MAFSADNLNRNLIFQSLNQVEVHLLIKGSYCIVPSPSTVLPGIKLQRYPPSTLNRPKILFQDINIFFCNCLDVDLVFTYTTKGNFTGTSIIIQFINDTVFDRGLALSTMFTSILQVDIRIVSRFHIKSDRLKKIQLFEMVILQQFPVILLPITLISFTKLKLRQSF